MSSSSHFPSSIIYLSIGGKKFTTTVDTITLREPDSILAAMFSGRHNVITDIDGHVFIDRDAKHFRHILNWLRFGLLPSLQQGEAMELLQEAEFFQLLGLIIEIKAKYVVVDLTRSDILRSIQPPCNVTLRLRGAKLKGVDMSGLYLRNAIFSYANLEGANLDNTNLRGAVMKNANLNGASLVGAKLMESDLTRANLNLSNVSKAFLMRANMYLTKFAGANMTDTNLNQVDLSSADLTGVILDGANISRCNLDKKGLNGACMVSANLSNSILLGVQMAGANLKNAFLTCVELKSYADFHNTNFEGENMMGSVLFFGPNMRGASLKGALMHRATVRSTLVGSTTVEKVAREFNIDIIDVDMEMLSSVFRNVLGMPRVGRSTNFPCFSCELVKTLPSSI